MPTRCLVFCVILAAVCSFVQAGDQEPYGTITGWGELIDPDRDCLFGVGADQIGIQIPGTPHDLSVELKLTNAPRVLQPLEGDFDLEVKVKGTLAPDEPTVATRTAYAGAGLLLIRDEANYIRLERAALRRGGTTRHYVNFEQRQEGRLVRFGRPDDFELDENKPVQLKLSVTGRTVAGWVRHGEDDWHSLGEKTLDQSGMPQGGIAAINATNAPMVAEFYDLQVTPREPLEQEPATEAEAVAE